jgi:Cdc6-like AAA superfamily ATPase
MNSIDLNLILNRNEIYKEIYDFLTIFKNNKNNVLTKRGIYIYGNPGIGKTTFIQNLLKDMNYDIIKYDAGDIRNKNVLENITKQNMSDKNVLSLLQKKQKEIAIVMDEIDGMNNGDKGGINSLIKLIRPKKQKNKN